MATLAELLQTAPAHTLRAIATSLGVRQRGQARKAEWMAAILAYWQPPVTGTARAAALPPAAQAAYQQLRTAGQLPSTLFWQEYGPLRLPRDEMTSAAPWQAPQSISEVLYYQGLLYPVGHRQINKAPWLTTPTDLPISELAAGNSPLALPLTEATSWQPWFLLHDVAQYLIYRQQHLTTALLHDHWLPFQHLQALNRRLLRPAPPPLPRSHKATPRLALLAFLAQAADLVDRAGITASGWQWLTDAAHNQLRTLWRGWVQAPMALRARHAQADAHLPAPWPQPLLQWLGQQAAPFSAQTAAAHLLGAQPALADYFVAHLTAVSDLAERLAPLFALDLCQLGLLLPADANLAPASPLPAHDGQRRYSLSSLGAWLLHPSLPTPTLAPAVRGAAADGGLPLSLPGLLTVPVDLPFALQARLAAYTDYQPELPADVVERTTHRYELTAATVARAATQDQPLSVFVATLVDLGYRLDERQMAWLHQAYTDGHALQLVSLPILRSDSTARLAALQQDQRLASLLGERLGPTTITVQTTLTEAYRSLTKAGHLVIAPTTTLAPESPDDAADVETAISSPALLWLAGRLYQALGEHLPALPPLPSVVLAQLCQQIDPATQAVVQSQFHALHAALQQLLDGYHLMPPTLPSLFANDLAALRQQFEQAISAKQLVQIRYYTAGRNLVTVRLIEPYWLEERHGIAYLRAYCHSAGAVLTFRLDRIEALVLSPEVA